MLSRRRSARGGAPRACSAHASSSARNAGRSVRSLSSTENGNVTTHASPRPMGRRPTRSAPSAHFAIASKAAASSGGKRRAPRGRSSVEALGRFGERAGALAAMAPGCVVSLQAIGAREDAARASPRAERQRRAVRARGATTPPPIEERGERVALLGRQPGRVVEDDAERRRRDPPRDRAWRGAGRTSVSSFSEDSACSTMGAPPVATASVAASATTAMAPGSPRDDGRHVVGGDGIGPAQACARGLGVVRRQEHRDLGARGLVDDGVAKNVAVRVLHDHFATGRALSRPASHGDPYARTLRSARIDGAVGPVARELGQGDPEREIVRTGERRSVGVPIGEIAENDDAPIELRQRADEAPRQGHGAVEIGAPVGRAQAPRSHRARRRGRSSRASPTRAGAPARTTATASPSRAEARSSRAPRHGLARSATRRRPSRRMLIESSTTSAIATEAPPER